MCFKGCPKVSECRLYEPTSLACNEGYSPGYCGAERFMDENENNPEHYDDYGYKG